MNFSTLILCGLSVLSATSSWGWLGVKSPASHTGAPSAPEAPPVTAAAKPRPADSTLLSRQVMFIPTGSHGEYLGTLEGVRCFNCAPDLVQLNLGDSVSHEAATVSLRIEAWNAIERPVKDRRMFDYANRCFYFGYKEVDTVFVGGEWTAVRVQDIPCYPYLRRLRQTPAMAQPVASEPERAPAAAEAPVTGSTRSPVDRAMAAPTAPSATAGAINRLELGDAPLRSARQEEEAEPTIP
jgi:hypothetical protein